MRGADLIRLSPFKRRRPKSADEGFSLPAGCVLWAVGDIHGRLDLLEPLLAEMLADLSRSAAERRILVFLGDYIDRGADSAGVIDRLCRLQDQPSLEAHFLRGNHEDRMEAFFDDPSVGPDWCDYGGREALRSYGVTAPTVRSDENGWIECAGAFRKTFPDRHRQFLASQDYSFSIGDYFFAHAGARPGVALADQSSDDLMWIRQDFLADPAVFEKMVVHGHTRSTTVETDHRRIGIDTGAYATGVLTGLRLEGRARSVLQTAKTDGEVTLTRSPLPWVQLRPQGSRVTAAMT